MHLSQDIEIFSHHLKCRSPELCRDPVVGDLFAYMIAR
jgi:hypothetical protein